MHLLVSLHKRQFSERFCKMLNKFNKLNTDKDPHNMPPILCRYTRTYCVFVVLNSVIQNFYLNWIQNAHIRPVVSNFHLKKKRFPAKTIFRLFILLQYNIIPTYIPFDLGFGSGVFLPRVTVDSWFNAALSAEVCPFLCDESSTWCIATVKHLSIVFIAKWQNYKNANNLE